MNIKADNNLDAIYFCIKRFIPHDMTCNEVGLNKQLAEHLRLSGLCYSVKTEAELPYYKRADILVNGNIIIEAKKHLDETVLGSLKEKLSRYLSWGKYKVILVIYGSCDEYSLMRLRREDFPYPYVAALRLQLPNNKNITVKNSNRFSKFILIAKTVSIITINILCCILCGICEFISSIFNELFNKSHRRSSRRNKHKKPYHNIKKKNTRAILFVVSIILVLVIFYIFGVVINKSMESDIESGDTIIGNTQNISEVTRGIGKYSNNRNLQIPWGFGIGIDMEMVENNILKFIIQSNYPVKGELYDQFSRNVIQVTTTTSGRDGYCGAYATAPISGKYKLEIVTDYTKFSYPEETVVDVNLSYEVQNQ